MREPRRDSQGRRGGRLLRKRSLLVLAAVACGVEVAPTVWAAPITPEQVLKITPVPAIMSIAFCAAEKFNAEAPSLGTEQHRVWEACQHNVTGSSKHVTLELVKNDNLPWVSCRYGVTEDGYKTTKPLDGRCAAHFGLNETATHFEFGVWTETNNTLVEYTFAPMVDTVQGMSVLTQAGRDYWNASPWVECTIARDACHLIDTPAAPPVDRPGG